ncbi:MAG TPA: DUF2141 domain-containing protein [Rhodanobacteraceae bacterium]|nr:DUF2141 domain-containing protein [Rhodanobacteraceae bacterium]
MTAKTIVAAILLSFSAAALAAPDSGTLSVEVTGLSSVAPVHLGLWDSADAVLSSKPATAHTASVEDGTASWTLKNVPYGTYAVAAWQDLQWQRRA